MDIDDTIASGYKQFAINLIEELDIALTTYYIARKMVMKPQTDDELRYAKGVSDGIKECINLIQEAKKRMEM